MKGLSGVAKGRIEEAAGALTGNDKLRAKGQADQAMGHLKVDAEKGILYAEDFARKIMDRAKLVSQEVVESAKIKAIENISRQD